MPDARVYTQFREDINDSTTPYTVRDDLVFDLLDAGIDFVSSKVDFIHYEEITYTQADINNGFFQTTKDIVNIQLADESSIYADSAWYQILEDNKVGFIRPSEHTAGTKISLRYRAKYQKFKGQMVDQASMDLPRQLELAVRLFALSELLRFSFVYDATDPVSGIVRVRSEENMREELELNGVVAEEVKNPRMLVKRANDLIKRAPNASNLFFSIQIK